MSKQIPLIDSFPQDNRIYRLSLFGSLDHNPLVASHPIVRVLLTPLKKSFINYQTAHQISEYDHYASKIVEVGVGMLPYLQVGSLWRNRQRIASPHYEEQIFQVGPAARQLTPAMKVSSYFLTEDTNRVGGSRRCYYLPFQKYPFASEGLKARILVLPAYTGSGEPVTLIVLCHEIFRFYYANSTPMTIALLNGELTDHENGIFNPDPDLTYLDPATGEGVLRLRQRMVDEDAPIAGRIALDDYARGCASDIHASIVRNMDNSGYFALDAYPPFSRNTTWKVRGISYLLGEANFFFIYSIETCTAMFPFTSLLFSRDNDGRTNGVDDPDRPEANWKAKRKERPKTTRKDRESRVRFDYEPARNEPLTKVALDSTRFLDLINKQIEKEEKTEVNYRASNKRRPLNEDFEGYGMGKGTSQATPLNPLCVATKVDAPVETRPRIEPPPPTLEKFQEVLGHLAGEGVSISLVPIDDDGELPETQGYSFIPIAGAWSYTNSRKKVRRQVVVAQAVHKDINFYLFEIARRIPKQDAKHQERFATLLLYRADGQEIDEGDLKEVLLLCAQNNGVWPDERQLRELRRRRFVHASPTSEAFAKRIFDFIDERAFMSPIESAPHDSAEALSDLTDAAQSNVA